MVSMVQASGLVAMSVCAKTITVISVARGSQGHFEIVLVQGQWSLHA